MCLKFLAFIEILERKPIEKVYNMSQGFHSYTYNKKQKYIKKIHIPIGYVTHSVTIEKFATPLHADRLTQIIPPE